MDANNTVTMPAVVADDRLCLYNHIFRSVKSYGCIPSDTTPILGAELVLYYLPRVKHIRFIPVHGFSMKSATDNRSIMGSIHFGIADFTNSKMTLTAERLTQAPTFIGPVSLAYRALVREHWM